MIINDIERTIREQLKDKKIYIYIETDKYDPNYSQRNKTQENTIENVEK